jgi:GntR family transcriptional regulator
MQIDHDAEEFPYEQLARYFRERIRSRADAPGTKLPSYAAITAQTGLDAKTIRRAMETLEREGLVRIRASRGTFVA